MILYCATTNPGKLAEFRLAAGRSGPSGLRLEVLPGLAGLPPCPETGLTFRDNAILKALHYGAYTREFLFADDSGLAVDALGGAPGVRSARFAGPDAGDEDNNRLLLERMRGVQDRRARFVCVVALVRSGGLVETFEGVVEGSLLVEPRGTNGFGYDPLFYYPPFQRTLAEASPEQKLAVSHRGKALGAMFDHLSRIGA